MVIEEVRKFIGKVGEPILMEVEKGPVRRYADAVGDPNPLYRDEEYARKSGHRSIMAPPGFLGWPVQGGDLRAQLSIRKEVTDFLAERGYGRILEGELEFEFVLPVHAGDTLVALPKIADIREREGKSGKMVFVVIEIAFTKQNNEPIAKMHQILIVS